MKTNTIILIAGLVLVAILCIISFKTTNHNVELWTSIAAGFTVGLLLLKAPKKLTQKEKQDG